MGIIESFGDNMGKVVAGMQTASLVRHKSTAELSPPIWTKKVGVVGGVSKTIWLIPDTEKGGVEIAISTDNDISVILNDERDYESNLTEMKINSSQPVSVSHPNPRIYKVTIVNNGTVTANVNLIVLTELNVTRIAQ